MKTKWNTCFQNPDRTKLFHYVLIPYTHSLCAPKGIIINSGPVLGYVKIRKVRYHFRHEAQ